MPHQTVFCALLKENLPSLSFPPYPGEKGQRIMSQISQEAWNMWIKHQTMLINEHHLNLLNPEARVFLNKEMENFLFGGGSDKPKGYVPLTSN